jgi:hypothetical protein
MALVLQCGRLSRPVALAAQALVCSHGAQDATSKGAFGQIVVGGRPDEAAPKGAKTRTVGIDRAIAPGKNHQDSQCGERFEHERLPLLVVDR